MNPFDLRGPQYLLFYTVVAVATLVLLGWLRRLRERAITGDATPRLHDPYAIAFLRGGKHELVRVATVSLVDRGLLVARSEQLVTSPVGRETQVRKRIEQDILRFCEEVRHPAELFETTYFDIAEVDYRRELEQHKLLPDDEIRSARWPLFVGAAFVLLYFSVTKILIALQRGRTNVGFLILLTVFGLIVAANVTFPRLTDPGKRFLEQLRNVFRSLRLRAPQIRPGGANADLVLAAAVFGTDILSYRDFSWVWKMLPRGSGGDASSGSSCSSSSGCGGGCGGGGCGGCGG